MEHINNYTSFIPINRSDNFSEKKLESKEDLKKACQEFESIFLNQLMKSMRDTVPDSGFFDKGVAFNIVQSMHDEALTEELSNSGGIGLAKQLYDQLSKYA